VARDREQGERRFLRRGSTPLAVHGLIEYGIGVLLIFSSSLLSYDDDTAKAVSILLGAAVLVITALSDMPTALLRRIPLGTHILLDFVIGVLLIVLPIVWFDSNKAIALSVVIGLFYLVLTAVTRFRKPE
jgi:VIT1/CCC1 family predicted Fe2+/Mn2+ transporter